MIVYLDEAKLQVSVDTLGAALAAGTAASEQRGRIIVEVWADNAPAPDMDLNDPPPRSPYAKEIRFVTAEPQSLVRVVLLDVCEALHSTRESQLKAADHLQIGETSPALRELGEALQNWETVRRAVEEGCGLLRISTNGAAGDEHALRGELVRELSAKLSSVKDALAREDWSILADLLAYDLTEQIEAWQKELRRLVDMIASSP